MHKFGNYVEGDADEVDLKDYSHLATEFVLKSAQTTSRTAKIECWDKLHFRFLKELTHTCEDHTLSTFSLWPTTSSSKKSSTRAKFCVFERRLAAESFRGVCIRLARGACRCLSVSGWQSVATKHGNEDDNVQTMMMRSPITLRRTDFHC